MLTQATLIYKAENLPGNRFMYSAACPDHPKAISHDFLGPGVGQSGRETWKFSCKGGNVKGVKGKVDHTFAALPDPTAPRTPGEVSAWLAARKAEKAGISYQ